MSASATAKTIKAAAKFKEEFKNRKDELKTILEEGNRLLAKFADAVEFPLKHRSFTMKRGSKKPIQNTKDESRKLDYTMKLPLCLRSILSTYSEVISKKEELLLDLQRGTEREKVIQTLGEFAYVYSILWSKLASLATPTSDCEPFSRLQEFGVEATKFYETIMKADSAILYFIALKKKKIEAEKIAEVIAYYDALASLDALKLPSPPTGLRGGGRMRRGRATRRRRS